MSRRTSRVNLHRIDSFENIRGGYNFYQNLPNPLDLIPDPGEIIQEEPITFAGHFLWFFKKLFYFMVVLLVLICFSIVLAEFNQGQKIVAGPNCEETLFDISRKLLQVEAQLKGYKKMLQNDRSENKEISYYTLLNIIDDKIERALATYDNDKIGTADYALESAGGRITSIPDTKEYPNHYRYRIGYIFTYQTVSKPALVIQPNNHPGQCFAFHGSTGRIRINLAAVVYITSVTLEHVSPKLILNANSAPKDFKVYGLDHESSKMMDELGKFTYQLGSKPLQTFRLEQAPPNSYRHVELQILNNYGNRNYTCVYRFRVHGVPMI